MQIDNIYTWHDYSAYSILHDYSVALVNSYFTILSQGLHYKLQMWVHILNISVKILSMNYKINDSRKI